MPRLTLREPWLVMDLGPPHQVAGWPIVGPAWGMASRIVWLQVKDADLPPGIEPEAYFGSRAKADGVTVEIGLMTAAEISLHACERAGLVTAVVTAGLTNGESVEPATLARPAEAWRAGTVNTVLHSAVPLTQGALFEAISIAAEARTAAILDLGLTLADGRKLSGTGTDCIVVAAPSGPNAEKHCGLHTEIGRRIGETVYRATRRAITPP